jgi:hypothetical protein
VLHISLLTVLKEAFDFMPPPLQLHSTLMTHENKLPHFNCYLHSLSVKMEINKKQTESHLNCLSKERRIIICLDFQFVYTLRYRLKKRRRAKEDMRKTFNFPSQIETESILNIDHVLL